MSKDDEALSIFVCFGRICCEALEELIQEGSWLLSDIKRKVQCRGCGLLLQKRRSLWT